VQLRNPAFLRIFFLEHNLERFATNRFEHYHPFWYYVPVVLLGLTPWAVIAIAAFVNAVRGSINEWKARRSKYRYLGHGRAGDAFPEFLVLWAVVVIVFFSFSESKLPGYILPALPPIAILTGDYLNRIRSRGLNVWLLVLHAVLTGILAMFVLLMPLHLHNPEAIPPRIAIVAASMVGVAAAVFILITVVRFGLKRLRLATMTPMAVLLLYMFGVGPVFGFGPMPNTKHNINLMDMSFSSRPLAQILNEISPPPALVAEWKVRRDVEYGLSFYRNSRVVDYDVGIAVADAPPGAGGAPQGVTIDQVKEGSWADEIGLRRVAGENIVAVNGQPVLNAADFNAMMAGWRRGQRLEFEVIDPRIPVKAPQFLGGVLQDGIPQQEHLLVIPESALAGLRQELKGRRYELLFTYPAQGLVVCEVQALEPATASGSR
jgi:4-amino-4-deoxy-L-arabinose transferase-like glycosyltransferase